MGDRELMALTHLKNVVHWSEELIEIPGTKIRVGLDGLMGLIPGFGDFAGAFISGYIILVAASLNISKLVLARMIFNVSLDFAVGLVPFAGDLFDIAFKANRKNVELLEKHLYQPQRVRSRSLIFLLLILFLFLAMFIVGGYAAFWVGSKFFNWLGTVF